MNLRSTKQFLVNSKPSSNESTRHLSSSQPELPSITCTSFASEIEEELMVFMDQLDDGMMSSTPVDLSHSLKQMASFPSKSHLDVKDSTHFTNQSLPLTFTHNSIRNISILQKPCSVKNCLSLSEWDLPQSIVDQYRSKGIVEMFPWQAECLSLPDVLSNGSVVYSAPTSAGKTLIAELLSLKCILENRKKVVMVLPFVSIVNEKVKYLKEIFEPIGAKIGGFMGNHSPYGGINSVDIAVCTIEKANSLINHLIENNSVYQLGVVVVDELQMIGDPHRGYILELLLTKLLHVMKKNSVAANDSNDTSFVIQLVGMTAKLPNLSIIAKWLKAQAYSTDFRPVPLKEMVKIGNIIYDTDFCKVKELPCIEKYDNNEEKDLSLICHEKVNDGHSVLIFCPTKLWCEKLCLSLVKYDILNDADKYKLQLNAICKELEDTQVGLDPVLAKTLSAGVAFHHAGLTLEERQIIELGFRQMSIKILVATSTLSTGVNLPARLVIIRTPFFQQNILDTYTYQQMIGRAGRMGIDQEGESILFCKLTDKLKVSKLINSSSKPIKSCLINSIITHSGKKATNEKDALNRAILEVIVNGTDIYKDIIMYMSCTFLCLELLNNSCNKDIADNLSGLVDESLKYLLDHEFIGCRKTRHVESSNENSEVKYFSTQLGSATVAASLSPYDALTLYSELQKAQHALVLENELHLIYLVTPVGIVKQWPSIDWYKFYCVWDQLTADMKHVGGVVGVQESFLIRSIQGNIPERTQAQKEKVLVHRRFFTSLVLHDLVKEVTINIVSKKYGASKGFLQSLQLSAGTFSGMVTTFCNRLGWNNMEALLNQFRNRLVFGIEKELCELVNVSIINGRRARFLYNNGYHTLSDLASANVSKIESLLRKAFPFETKTFKNEHHIANNEMSEFEAATLIIQEAQQLLSEYLNIPSKVLVWNIPSLGRDISQQFKSVAKTDICTSKTALKRNSVMYLDNNKDIKKSKKLKLEGRKLSSPASMESSQADQKSSFDLFLDCDSNYKLKEKPNFSLKATSHVTCMNSSFNFNTLLYEHTTTLCGVTVVHLSANQSLLDMFVKECTSKGSIGFSVAVENNCNKGIGAAYLKSSKSCLKGLPVKSQQVMGISFTWGDTMMVYYLSLCESENAISSKESLSKKVITEVPLSLRIKALRDIFSLDHTYTLVSVNFKQQIKYIMASCNMEVFGRFFDPQRAHWMLDPDSNELNLFQLIAKYLTKEPTLLSEQGNQIPLSSLVIQSNLSHLQAAAEAILSILLMTAMQKYFRSNELMDNFIQKEMPVISVLAKLELNGIGISQEKCRSFEYTIEQCLENLKSQAFKYAGKTFSLSSPMEVEKVIFHELKLPLLHAEVYENDFLIHVSTCKNVLEKISSLHPLPGVIIEWRCAFNAASSLKSLLRLCQYDKLLDQFRVHSTCLIHTATGRIIMSDPNIQNFPKEYAVDSPLSQMNHFSLTKNNLRNVFKSHMGTIFIAADYCQLELRILAHLSQDDKLCKFLNEEGDAFCKIASEWLNVDCKDISDKQRQHTKQLCYGLIYGMGTKSLGHQLNVSDSEACNFIETFKSRFTGLKSFITQTIKECREKGYVTTIFGRKRYLSSIYSKSISERAQAERQAVNSTVQGSASDLVKKAMSSIDQTLVKSGFVTFLPSCEPSQLNNESGVYSTVANTALLVLQLHDELMYEVDENKVDAVAKKIKTEMESAVAMRVILPVKIKVGKTWGELEDYILK